MKKFLSILIMLAFAISAFACTGGDQTITTTTTTNQGSTVDDKYSEGLEFTLNDDGVSYSVIGIGTCTDTDIIIPSMYNGLSIISIAERAFLDCGYIRTVVISDYVQSIGAGAFGSCVSLESVVIPDSVTSIDYDAFTYCFGLTSITFKGTVEQWNNVKKSSGWNGYGEVPATEVVCSDGTVPLK